MAKVESPRRPDLETAAALVLVGGGGVAAWWGTLGSGVLWLVPLIAIAALTAAGLCGVRTALIVAVAWLPGAMLAAGLPISVLAPASHRTTADLLRAGAEALTGSDAIRPLLRDWTLAVALLAGGTATLLAGALLRGRRPARLLGLALALAPLGAAIALQRISDPSWLGALLVAATVLWFARGRFVPIAVATSLVAAVALFGAQVAAPRAGWQPFGHDSHPEQFHELSTRQSYGPLEGERTGETMLELTAPQPALWRMQVLEGFDNRRWRAIGMESQLPEPAARRESVGVTVRGLENTLVVSPGKVVKVHAGEPVAARIGEGWTLAEKPSDGDSYRVVAEPVQVPASRLESIPIPPPRRYESLIQIGLGGIPEGIPVPLSLLARNVPEVLRGTNWERLFRLSARLSRGHPSELDVVRRVEHYLMRGGRYRYTTEVGVPSDEPVLDFLFHTHAGYCQQFAGGAALLLRIAGVPSRVAVGFATGEEVRPHTWAVTDEDAHAWIEVYFPTVGWVPFNPTPAAAAADIAPGIDVVQPVARPLTSPDGLASQLAGAGAALILLLVAARLIGGRRGPRPRLADVLVGLSPGPATPRTTLRSLHPALAEIGPATADLALRAERSRFAPDSPADPARPRFAVWRALRSDVGPLRAARLMLRASSGHVGQPDKDAGKRREGSAQLGA
jgi:protein-glutamine gamma-glutamyltransferase